MLELLILYSLNKTELTLYGLKKYIFQNFGELSAPSHGSLHPALKRLCEKNIVSLRKKISDGGKQFSFYSVNNSFKNYFSEKFLNQNIYKLNSLDLFLSEIKTRVIVSDILDTDSLNKFKEQALLKLDYFYDVLNQKLNNSYIDYTDMQKKVLNSYNTQIKEYKNIVSQLD